MLEIFVGFVFIALFYGWIIFMLCTAGIIRKEWLYTIPIWPLALLVLLIYIISRGIEVLLRVIDL